MGMLKTAAYISLPILGLCATVLYLLHKKEQDDLQNTLEDVKTSRMKTIEMKIPKLMVGVVIGRGGSNIKEIQEETETKINFKDQDDNDDYRTCYIRGTADAAQRAETMIHEIITSQPVIEICETWVPQNAVGRIIGRNGENIRLISRASNAKVNVDSGFQSKGVTTENVGPSGVANETRVVIKGTKQQIAVALSLIQEKVDQDAEVRRNMELCQSNRSPRKQKAVTSSPSKVKAEQIKDEKLEVLTSTGSDGLLKVFVSAVDTPSCFWIQVFGPRAVELDHLISEMTDYYSVDENRSLHRLQEVKVGQIVAAPFINDNRWYRAEIKTIQVNNDNNNEMDVDLFYVDYGDSDFHKKHEIYQLRTDFLKLGFQAIECTLADVKPIEEERWSDKGCEVFEELVHVAQWKPLMAKVVSCDQLPRGRREGSPVPSVRLFDYSGSQDINIAEELVKQEFAVRENNQLSSSGSSPSHRSVNGTRSSGTSTPFHQTATSPEPSSDTESLSTLPSLRT